MQPQSSITGLALLDPKKIRFKKRSVHLGNIAFKSASSGCLRNQMENFDADFMLSGLKSPRGSGVDVGPPEITFFMILPPPPFFFFFFDTLN